VGTERKGSRNGTNVLSTLSRQHLNAQPSFAPAPAPSRLGDLQTAGAGAYWNATQML